MHFYVQLIITSCLAANPADCGELRTATGFATADQCVREAQLLVAGIMVEHPERRVVKYSCVRVPIEKEA